MPNQVFRITRAPEMAPCSPVRLRSLLWNDRRDGEWDVEEIEGADANYCKRLHDENAALRDAINALHECILGNRRDDHHVAELLNGAMRIPVANVKHEAEAERR